MRKFANALALTGLIITAVGMIAQAADQYKFNPFSGKLDNVGDSSIQSGYSTSQKAFRAYTAIPRAVVNQVVPTTTLTDNHVPSGFINHDTTTLSLTENVGGVNDTFTVTITGSDFPVYIAGAKATKNTESITQAGATSTRYYILYAPDGTLSIQNTPWDLESNSYTGAATIATVYWDAVNHKGILEDERHHSWRDVHWHHWAHHTVGSQYSEAHTANGLNITIPLTSSEYALFTVTGGDIYDEDVRNGQPAKGSTDSIKLFRHNTNGTMQWENATVPYKLVAGVPQHDTGTGLVGASASNNNGYFVSWIYGTNQYGSGQKIVAVMGQDADGVQTLSQAQAVGTPTFPAYFVLEWKLLWKVIYRYGTGGNITWISNTDYRKVSSMPQGQIAGTTVNAAAVTYSNYTSTKLWNNVQTAITETSRELNTHKTTTTDPHSSAMTVSGSLTTPVIQGGVSTGATLNIKGSSVTGGQTKFGNTATTKTIYDDNLDRLAFNNLSGSTIRTKTLSTKADSRYDKTMVNYNNGSISAYMLGHGTLVLGAPYTDAFIASSFVAYYSASNVWTVLSAAMNHSTDNNVAVKGIDIVFRNFTSFTVTDNLFFTPRRTPEQHSRTRIVLNTSLRDIDGNALFTTYSSSFFLYSTAGI